LVSLCCKGIFYAFVIPFLKLFLYTKDGEFFHSLPLWASLKDTTTRQNQTE